MEQWNDGVRIIEDFRMQIADFSEDLNIETSAPDLKPVFCNLQSLEL
ncbi:MAG: hypothetical protein PVF76_06560 [Syntrophobacterales bacterium]|jgi:hypothetical protein